MWKQFDSWTNREPIFRNNLYYFEIDDEDQRRDFFPKGRSYEQWSNNGERDEGQGPDVRGRPGRGLAPETRVSDGTYARGPARPEERVRTLICYEYFNLLLYEFYM